jgi:hypothetical protein
MKVHARSLYRFDPVLIDRCNPPYGVEAGLLKAGDVVRVVNLHGCPRANTMNHCHIETPDGSEFLGMVSCNSLVKVTR